MVKTHGLTHISLTVRDPERSLRFYREVFGVCEYGIFLKARRLCRAP